MTHRSAHAQRPFPGPFPAAMGSNGNSRLKVKVSRPTRTAVIVHIRGDLDSSTVPHLHEVLAPRLDAAQETLVLDLSEVPFLGVAGLELLARAQRRAAYHGIQMRLVTGPVCVDRALAAGGLVGVIPSYPTTSAAVNSGQADGSTPHPRRPS